MSQYFYLKVLYISDKIFRCWKRSCSLYVYFLIYHQGIFMSTSWYSPSKHVNYVQNKISTSRMQSNFKVFFYFMEFAQCWLASVVSESSIRGCKQKNALGSWKFRSELAQKTKLHFQMTYKMSDVNVKEMFDLKICHAFLSHPISFLPSPFPLLCGLDNSNCCCIHIKSLSVSRNLAMLIH